MAGHSHPSSNASSAARATHYTPPHAATDNHKKPHSNPTANAHGKPHSSQTKNTCEKLHSNSTVNNCKELPSGTTEHSGNKSKMFALIIAINTYLHAGVEVTNKDGTKTKIPNLGGCISDATKVHDYLQSSLGIPCENIRCLTDSGATSSAIEAEFQHMASDSRIERGSPIIIFYAGHGGEYELDSGDKIQALIPYNFWQGEETKERHQVPALTDWKLGRLINAIAANKGNNITVIFDCCHSASITREQETARSIHGPLDTSLHLNDNDAHAGQALIPASRAFGPVSRASKHTFRVSAPISKSGAHIGLKSHMLLSACQSTEKALESSSGGYFTDALLSLFRQYPATSSDGQAAFSKLRYSDILQRLPKVALGRQNPQCEGDNQHRYLFSEITSASEAMNFTLREEHGDLVINGGLAHDIQVGDRLKIALGNNVVPGSEIAIYFKVAKVGAFSAVGTLALDFSSPKLYTAVQAELRRPLRLSMDCIPTPKLSTLLSLMVENRIIELVPDQGDKKTQHPHMSLEEVEHDRVILRPADEVFAEMKAPLAGPHFEVSLGKLETALKTSAFYYLNRDRRGNTSEDCDITGNVTVRFYKVRHGRQNRGDRYEYVRPADSPDLCINKKIDIKLAAGRPEPYGIELVNNSFSDLFPSVFFFDNGKLSITSYYEHPPGGAAHSPEAPLKKGTSFTIGYGASGTSPFGYKVPTKDRPFDNGLLKIFLFTQPVDLSHLKKLEDGLGMLDRETFVFSHLPWTANDWDIIDIPITTR